MFFGETLYTVSVHCFSGKFPCVVARMSKKVFVCAYGREEDSEDETKDNSDSEDANDLSHLTSFSPSHTMAHEKYMQYMQKRTEVNGGTAKRKRTEMNGCTANADKATPKKKQHRRR